MKSIVLYTTKTGNTEKVAKAISDALKTDCVNITDTTDFFKLNLNKYDHFFLGSGVYGGKPHKNIIKFLNQFDFQSQKIIVLFLPGLEEVKVILMFLKTLKIFLTIKIKYSMKITISVMENLFYLSDISILIKMILRMLFNGQTILYRMYNNNMNRVKILLVSLCPWN